MQPKARMTIRFEPPKPVPPMKSVRQPLKAEQQPIIEEIIEQEYTVVDNSFTTWDSPYQDDIHALEEVIRSADTKKVEESIYAPYPAIKDDFSDDELVESWSGASIEQEDESQSGWLNQSRSVRDSPTWGRVFISVTAAVVTGALFGYMVLSIFTGQSLLPGKADNKPQAPVQASQETSAASSSEPVTTTLNGNDTVTQTGVQGDLSQIPANDYYMLQFGVFQNEESMQVAVQQLQELGFDSTIEAQEGYRVYVGTAGTREEAELLAAQMSDIELYIKPLGGDPLNIGADSLPEGGAEWMTASAELTRQLIQASSSYLQMSLPETMNESELSALQEAHRNWLSKTAVVDTFNNEMRSEVKSIVQALNSAALSIAEYNRKPSRFHMWSVQSQAMKAVLADRNLRASIQSVNKG